MSLGDNIKNRRLELGITQLELAKKLDISQSMICQIERGTKNPSLQIGCMIAQELKCKVEDLINNREEMQ